MNQDASAGPRRTGGRATGRAGLLLCALAVALSGCGRQGAEAGKGAVRAPEPTPVTLSVVTNVSWEQGVPIVGTLYPKDEAAISARVEGQVERTIVDFGDRVRSGDDLALIDTAAYETQLLQASASVARAEANLENARLSYNRVETLQKEKVASPSDFDQAKAQLDQWEAEVKAARAAESQARLNLSYSKVQAPFDGAISQRLVGRGDYVKVGAPLFNLVNDAVLKFIFPVPERYASQVTKKLPVRFSVDNYPGETFTGSVYLISPAVSTVSRAFNVGALVTNTSFRLKASSFARGTIVLESGRPTPAVPLEAIISIAGVTSVFVEEQSKAHARLVRTGRIRDGLQEILDGLKAGDRVILTGQSRLTDGAPVAVNESPAASRAPAPASPSTQANEKR
jgi:membrane fusion protein (multidrug efflux system)